MYSASKCVQDCASQNVRPFDFLRERTPGTSTCTGLCARPKDLLRKARSQLWTGFFAWHGRYFGRRHGSSIGEDPAAPPSGNQARVDLLEHTLSSTLAISGQADPQRTGGCSVRGAGGQPFSHGWLLRIAIRWDLYMAGIRAVQPTSCSPKNADPVPSPAAFALPRISGLPRYSSGPRSAVASHRSRSYGFGKPAGLDDCRRDVRRRTGGEGG